MDVVKDIKKSELEAAGTTVEQFKQLVKTAKLTKDKKVRAEIQSIFDAIRVQRQHAKKKKQKKTVYLFGLDIHGVWRLSLATDDVGRAEIRYTDLQTLYPAVAATTSKAKADKLDGAEHAKARHLLKTFDKVAQGVPVKKLRALADDIPAKERNGKPVEYWDSRGASHASMSPLSRQNEMHSGPIRTGFAFNYYRIKGDDKAGLISTGLLPEQKALTVQQRKLRKKYGYGEHVAV